MKLYTQASEPMKVFWLFSGGASSLKATLGDGNNGALYRNVGAYCDREDAKGRQLCCQNGIPEFFRSRREFYARHSLDPKHPDSRRRFDSWLREKIDREFAPHLIALSGYMKILSDELFGYRPTLNIHPAHLGILSGPYVNRLDVSDLPQTYAKMLSESNGLTRKFTGDNAVLDAVMACEPTTRSTLHLVTEVVDGGPIIAQSKAFDVDPELISRIRRNVADGAAEYSSQLQERMKVEGDGPAFLKGLELAATGRLSIDGETLFLDGREMPYCGCRLG